MASSPLRTDTAKVKTVKVVCRGTTYATLLQSDKLTELQQLGDQKLEAGKQTSRTVIDGCLENTTRQSEREAMRKKVEMRVGKEWT